MESNRQALSPEQSHMPKSPLDSAHLELLWVRLAAIYGYRWSSAYGEKPADGAGVTWAQGLAGIDRAAIKRGLESCITSADPWPPTLPAFRAMCLGIPPLAAIRMEIRNGGNSPFACMVRAALDSYTFGRSSEDQASRMVRDAYEATRKKVMQGETPVGREHAPALPMLGDEPVKVLSPDARERVRATLDGLKTLFAAPIE